MVAEVIEGVVASMCKNSSMTKDSDYKDSDIAMSKVVIGTVLVPRPTSIF